MSVRVLVGLLIGTVVVWWAAARFSVDDDRLQFDRAMADWHARCDAALRVPADKRSPHAKDCVRQHQVLVTYAERKGWRGGKRRPGY